MKEHSDDFNNIKTYGQFVKMYYIYTMNSFPEEAFGSSKTITKKDRRVILILGYLYLVFAPFGLFISINKNYIIVLIIILLGIINLILSEFSLLFYAHQYYYFLKKTFNKNSLYFSKKFVRKIKHIGRRSYKKTYHFIYRNKKI